MSLLLLALLQFTAQAAAQPQLLSTSLMSSDDYPKAAVLLGQEGQVAVRLTIGPNGVPTRCAILQSSGFPALDTATCETLRARARFTPPIDSAGRPTTATWDKQVIWSIEGNELPVAPWTIRLMVALDKDGTPTNCAIQSGGALKSRDEVVLACNELSGAFSVPPELARRYGGHQAVLIFDQQFVPATVASIKTPRDLLRYPLVSKNVLRLSINSLGRVDNCAQTGSEGDYKPTLDPCAAMQARRFKPDSKRAGAPLSATATTAIYVYSK